MSTYKERLQASIANLQNQTNTISQIETVINSLPDRHNDIMLFETIEEMNAYPGAVDGTVAVVYRDTSENIKYNSIFSIVSFPESVVLPEAVTTSSSVRFSAVDQSVSFSCSGNLNATRFMLTMYTDDNEFLIQYTSSDGITYTRTKLQDIDGDLSNPVDIGVRIHFYGSSSNWKDAIGYFMQVGGKEFKGIYLHNGLVFEPYTAQLDAVSENAFSCNFYGKKGISNSALQVVTNLNSSQVWTRRALRSQFNNLSAGPDGLNGLYMNMRNLVEEDMSYLDTSNATSTINMFWSCSNLVSITNFNTVNVTNTSNMFQGCSNLITIPNFDISNATTLPCMFMGCNNLASIPELNTSKVVNMVSTFYRCSSLVNLPNLDTSNVEDMRNMLLNCWSLTEIPNFNTAKVVNMINTFSNCYNLVTLPNFNTINVTDMTQTFLYCNNLITIPNFDTSNVINMVNTFSGCDNITTIPNFNMINVETTQNMFHNCYKLSTVPNFDISNATNVTSMFNGCNAITTIPNLNTSKVTTTTAMFWNCHNLKSVPNFDTSNVTNMWGMFMYCYNLVTVPQFDFSSVKSFVQLYSYCNNLSTASIHNIINTCLNSGMTNANQMNLNVNNTYSIFRYTNITSSRYSNRLTELTQAGWKY